MKKAILISLSSSQKQVVMPILATVKDGAALMAQIYPDGMRIKAITVKQAAAIGKILGSTGRMARTAHEAHKPETGT